MTATEMQYATSEQKAFDATKARENAYTQAKQKLEATEETTLWDDLVNAKLASPEAIVAIKTEYGKKAIDNAVKASISFPYVIKTNKEVLAEYLEALDKEEDETKKSGIKESVVATLNQIISYEEQIAAHVNIGKTYNAILEKLNSL
jgi:hypothetical protein